MGSLGRRRVRRAWLLGAALVLLGAAAALAVLGWFLLGQDLEEASQWAGVLAMVPAVLTPAIALVVWMTRRALRVDDVSDEARLDVLRHAVYRTWSREVAVRGLRRESSDIYLPRPLHLRLRPASESGLAVAAADPGDASVWRGALARSSNAAKGLVSAFQETVAHQLVLIGGPGAGKTTLVVEYVREATFPQRVGGSALDPVPVPLSVAGWDPATELEDWVVDRVCQDYPQVAEVDVLRLVERRHLLPVLDGLDELPAMVRGDALARLQDAGAAGLRTLVTCRTEEYAHMTAQRVLPSAAVLEIEPVAAEDAAAYLTEGGASKVKRWDDVGASLTNAPHEPLASVLSTPLMIALARRVYQASSTNPKELLALPSADAVRRRLLDRYLPAVFPSGRGPASTGRWGAEPAGRWLAFLAQRLPDPPGDPDLRWWRLVHTVPLWTISALLTAAGGVLGAATGTLTEFARLGLAADIGRGLRVGAALGCLAGLVGAYQVARSADARPRRSIRQRAIAALANLLVVVALISALAAGALAIVYLIDRPAAVTAAAAAVDTVRDAMALRAPPLTPPDEVNFAGLLLAIALVTTIGLGAGRAGLPRRSAPQLRRLPAHLLVGLGAGAAAGLPLAVLSLLSVAASRSGQQDSGAYLAISALVAGFVAAITTVGRWLTASVTDAVAPSPPSLMRMDRRALLASVVGAVLAVVTLWILLGLVDSTPIDREFAGAAVAVAGSVAILVLLCSGSAWVAYTAARLSLAVSGRVPWRLMTFLRDAHDAGVVRQAGATYQIRHDLIRAYLVGRWPLRRGPRRYLSQRRPTTLWHTAKPRRRLAMLLTAIVAIVSLPITVQAVDPRPTPYATISGEAYVFSPDGSVLASVGADDRVRLWNVATGRALATIAPASSSGLRPSLAFSPDGQVLATGGDGRVSVWDTTTGALLATLEVAATVSPRTVAFSPDHRFVTTISQVDRRIRLWDTVTGRQLAVLDRVSRWWSVHLDCPVPGGLVVFAPTGRRLLTVGADIGQIRLWDVPTGRLVADLDRVIPLRAVPHNDCRVSSSATFPPDGRSVVTIGTDGIRLWDAATGSLIDSIPTDWVSCTVPSPDGRYLATGGQLRHDPHLRIWNTVTRRSTVVLENHSGCWPMTFSPDSRILAVGHAFDSRTTLVDTATGQAIVTLHDGELNGVLPRAVMRGTGGHTVATVWPASDRSGECSISLWDASTGRLLAGLDQIRGEPSFLPAPNGASVATLSASDNRVRLWDMDTGDLIATLDRLAPYTDTDVRFAADGRPSRSSCSSPLMATADAGMRFAAHGQALATISADGRVRLWRNPLA